MKVIKRELSRDLKLVEIITIADTHIGDKYCDLALIKETIKYVQEHDNVYVILNGDLINNAIRTSISDIYGEEMKPMEQIELLIELLTPIAPKILAVTIGNHEARTYKNDGVDILYLVCKQLGIEDLYSAESALIFLRFGELSRGRQESNGSGKKRMVCYTIYAIHGSGGGGKQDGGKINTLTNMVSRCDADVYIHSHTHLPAVVKKGFFRTDYKNSSIAPVTRLFVNTAAFLDYGGYGETAEFSPSSKDTPHIFLRGDVKQSNAYL